MMEKVRREGMRWHLLNTLHKASPYTTHEQFLCEVMNGIYPNVTPLEIRQQLEYLADRKLVELNKQPHTVSLFERKARSNYLAFFC